MKFILNESKKFLLEERFILNEADSLTEASAASIATKWATFLEKSIATAEQVLSKIKDWADISHKDSATLDKNTTAIKQLTETGEDLETSLSMPATELKAELASIKNEINAYLQVISNIQKLEEDEEFISVLAARSKKITAIANKSDWNSTEIAQLKDLIKSINDYVQPKFDSTEINVKKDQATNFKKLCEDCLELINRIKKLPKIDFEVASAEDLKAYINCASKIEQQANFDKLLKINKGIVIANLKIYTEKVTTVKQLYSEFLNLALLKKTEASNQYDWTARYNQAVDKDAIIEAFIYKMWPTAAKKVIEIKKAIQQECSVYGFSSENKFLSFISEIYLKYNLNVEAYHVIHNQVSNGVLQLEDLVASDNNVLGATNLIFCKNFYNLDTSNMKLYLQKQRALTQIEELPKQFSSTEELVFNILYKTTDLVKGAQNLSSINQELNSLPTVETLEKQYLGVISKTAVADLDEPKTQKNKISNAALISEINTAENAVKVLAALAIKFSSNDQVMSVINTCTKVTEFMNNNTTWNSIRKLVAQVERAYNLTSITASQAQNLAKSILEAEQFGLV